MLIRVDNPETENGLDWDGIEQLARSYEELQDNPDVRVGIITGNEQYFYTGGRVDPNAPGEKNKYTDALTHFLKTSGAVTKPMIAAVNGDCMKAGMGCWRCAISPWRARAWHSTSPKCVWVVCR